MKNMGEEGTGVRRDYMLKQIENEIAALRKALHISQPDGQSGREASDSEAARVRAVTQQVTELRQAIDNLAAAAGK